MVMAAARPRLPKLQKKEDGPRRFQVRAVINHIAPATTKCFPVTLLSTTPTARRMSSANCAAVPIQSLAVLAHPVRTGWPVQYHRYVIARALQSSGVPLAGQRHAPRIVPSRRCSDSIHDEPNLLLAITPPMAEQLIPEAVLVPRPVLNPNRRAKKPKRRANLILQKALIGKVQRHGPVGEEHEHRRRNSRLRHVEDFHALAYWNGGAFKVNRPQETVHLSGGNALAPLGSDLLDQRRNFFLSLAGVCGEKKHRSVGQKLESVAQALFVESPVLGALGVLDARGSRLADGALLAARHKIPFVDQDNHRASALMGIACNVSVEPAGAFGGVDHEEHDVGVLDIFARHYHRKLLSHQPRLAFAPNAGRINEANLAPFVLDNFVD